MTVDYAMSVVRLEPGEIVEVVLPNGNSVIVYGNGTVIKERNKK